MKRALLFFGLATVPLLSSGRGRPAAKQPAVIYLTYAHNGIKIAWQPLSSQHVQIIGKLDTQGPLPDSFGFLPSPDGNWLIAWMADFRVQDKYGMASTLWKLLRIRDGKARVLGHSSPGYASLLPYWIDDRHVVLEGANATSEVTTGKLSRSLPRRKEYANYDDQVRTDTSRLLSYCRKHYPTERKVILSSYAKLDGDLGISEYARRNPREQKEYLLLRCLGIPGLEVIEQTDVNWTHPRVVQVPRASVSPSGKFIACAYVFNLVPVKNFRGFYHADARLAVFDAALGKRLCQLTIASRPWRSKGFSVYIPPPPFTEPDFRDLRWSRDGRYFSFTTHAETGNADTWVKVMDTSTWKEALRIPNAQNAFVTPSPE